MFQSLRYRLLLSYLLVLASILGVFAIAVRVVFTHVLSAKIDEKLVALGQAAISLEQEDGRLGLPNDFPVKSLLDRDQALEWFDEHGKFINFQGRYKLSLPFTGKEVFQTQTGKPGIRGVTLPVSNSSRLIGYVRASQSLEEFDETIMKLDWGLGSGVMLALLLSSAGGAILTRQAMRPIEQSFQRLKQFTADASHELRSPLMAIETNVEVALTYPEVYRSQGDTEKFEAIASATNQMTRLTEDLLFLARMDNLPQSQQETVNLTDLLDELVQLYQLQAEKKEISLKINKIAPLYLLGDGSQLKRLFTNLIVNALRYTLHGGQVNIESHASGRQIIVNVSDTGIGIQPEQLAHIFDRFWQAERSRSYQSGSSGLGLAIAQAIAQTHRGEITVSSKFGVGSCFTVRLLSSVIAV